MATGNGAESARRAGYSGSAKTVGSTANRLLKREVIRDALLKAQTQRAERLDITADRVMIELSRIAFADVTDAIEIVGGVVTVKDTDELTPAQRASIAAIEETKAGLKVRMHPKAQALESLAKHFGLLIEKHSLDVSMTQRGPLELLIVDPMTPAEAAKACGDAPALAEG